MKKALTLLLCGSFCMGCQQFSKSIEDTFHPAVKETVVVPAAVPPNTTPYEAAVEEQIKQIEQQVTTMVETHTTTHTVHHKEGRDINFLTDEGKLNEAEVALKKLPQYAGKDIFIYATIHFYNDGSIHVMLQHPENPKYVDSYEYKKGQWSEPSPKLLSVRDNIQSRMVPLSSVRFATVAAIAKTYNEKAAQVEGAKPTTSVYVSVWDNRMRWFPSSINGSRERYAIEFGTDGTLKKFEQE